MKMDISLHTLHPRLSITAGMSVTIQLTLWQEVEF